MSKSDLPDRTKKFALDVISLINALPYSPSNKHISAQLIASGTSVGANYRAACRAKSRADFFYKIKVVLEESDESLFWLELLKETNPENESINFLLKESNELTAIFATILKSKNE